MSSGMCQRATQLLGDTTTACSAVIGVGGACRNEVVGRESPLRERTP